jgi:uncharacterized OB-fold protein
MSDYNKFLPPDDMPMFHAPFWESINNHQAKIQECSDCGIMRFIPLEICPKCHSADYQWAAISGRGSVYTYTIIHRAPTPAYQADAPYVIAHVTLEEGPRMIANMVGINPEDVQIGMPVHITYFHVGDGKSLFAFVPST